MLTKTEIIEQLKGFILSELLRKPDFPLGLDEPLITSGLVDSLSLARVGVFVEDAFDVYIPDDDLTVEKMDTVALMAARIREELERE